MFGFASVFTVVAIAVERYICVVRQRQLSLSHLATGIAGIWTMSFITAISPFWFGENIYELRSSGVLCLANWAHRSAHGKAFTAWTLLALTIAIIIITFSYYAVLRHIHNSRKALHLSTRPSAPSFSPSPAHPLEMSQKRNSLIEELRVNSDPQQSNWVAPAEWREGNSLVKAERVLEARAEREREREQERERERGRERERERGRMTKGEIEAAVAVRSVVIVTVFLLEWAPLGSVFAVEFFTGRAVSPLYDYIGKFCANSNFVCNAILFMVLDRRFSHRARALLSSLLAKLFPCFRTNEPTNQSEEEEIDEISVVVNGSPNRSVAGSTVGGGSSFASSPGSARGMISERGSMDFYAFARM
ncbi:hypothetical protein HDV00_007328 [Rhizophlyctis rosea]|nr:hypothetical protein HDV00_007328 [Rhizophlyctis rosea]